MKFKFVIAVICLFSTGNNLFAQGDLLITPTRIVFEGSKQMEEINLVNLGKDTTTYSISLLHYNQTPNGGYKIIKRSEAGAMIADPFLRFFPREVTLAPGEPQVIMLQYRRKAEMASGEYRAHLYFRSEKDYKQLSNKIMDTLKTVSVQVIPIYGISIPVIIRTGALNVITSLTNLRLETEKDSIKSLNLFINREGNCSGYGDLTVKFIPLKGKTIELGRVKGVKIFTDLNQLSVSVQLVKLPVLALKEGKIKVLYTSPGDTKYIVYAEKELPISQQETEITQIGANPDNVK